MEDETGLWMCDEGMYVRPWTLGNPNSESFGYDFMWGFAGGTETERETLISGLEVAGFELDSKSKAYTLSADEGTYYVFVSEYFEYEELNPPTEFPKIIPQEYRRGYKSQEIRRRNGKPYTIFAEKHWQQHQLWEKVNHLSCKRKENALRRFSNALKKVCHYHGKAD